MTPPRIWVLLGARKGDNNQVLGLAEALGLPLETRTLGYNLLRALGGALLGNRLWSLDRESRRWLEPPWPDAIIAIGRRSVPVTRWLRRMSGGRTRLIRLGHPRMDPNLFDLVITTRQYPVPEADNVVLLPLAMSRYHSRPEPTGAERGLLAALPQPHLLMAIGGPTKYWRLPDAMIADSARRLADRAAALGGSLLVIGSQRTEPRTLNAIRSALEHRPNCRLLGSNSVRFPVLLDDAQEIFVTGDSISMLSEAVLSGKKVGLIPIELNVRGRRALGRADEWTPRRDLRRFWQHLEARGLIGSLDEPASGEIEDPVKTAAAAVRRLLGDGV